MELGPLADYNDVHLLIDKLGGKVVRHCLFFFKKNVFYLD